MFFEITSIESFLQDAYSKAVIGAVVMTKYNSKTYRVDEVDYTVTPVNTFETKKKGVTSHIKYTDYFRDVRIIIFFFLEKYDSVS